TSAWKRPPDPAAPATCAAIPTFGVERCRLRRALRRLREQQMPAQLAGGDARGEVFLGETLEQRFRARLFDQRDDRSAESRAGDPRTERAALARELDQELELGGRNLAVVAQARVRVVH